MNVEKNRVIHTPIVPRFFVHNRGCVVHSLLTSFPPKKCGYPRVLRLNVDNSVDNLVNQQSSFLQIS